MISDFSTKLFFVLSRLDLNFLHKDVGFSHFLFNKIQLIHEYWIFEFFYIHRIFTFQMIIVDNYHKVSTKGEADNYQLNLDGILFLGIIYNIFPLLVNILCYNVINFQEAWNKVCGKNFLKCWNQTLVSKDVLQAWSSMG